MTGLRILIRTTWTEIGKDPLGTFWYRVIAEWDDPVTHQTYIFGSKLLRDHPRFSSLLGSEHMVSVLIDPDNPHRYLMECSW